MELKMMHSPQGRVCGASFFLFFFSGVLLVLCLRSLVTRLLLLLLCPLLVAFAVVCHCQSYLCLVSS